MITALIHFYCKLLSLLIPFKLTNTNFCTNANFCKAKFYTCTLHVIQITNQSSDSESDASASLSFDL